ncbi:hypothetical protein [Amycolatopsis sp.]|uniref:hypothetical protein n=1 Tax=Amycolatopsis sp. TaxID=37632 RepID=UPI002B9F846A|nr:hypothetical protein [Amycolatopsis sp.]HVV11629.1 hypothetical protein [Amycolatopsis sp.]
MARSTYIYIAWNWLKGEMSAAFTVKHELATWLRRQDDPHHFDVIRVRDGGWTGWEPVVLSLGEILREG